MQTETGQTIYLKDYAPSPYRIASVELEFRIAPETSTVRAQLTIEPAEGTERGTPLVLDGDGLTLKDIAIDGAPLKVADYIEEHTSLTIIDPPARRFVLETTVTVSPETNTALMGLYRSNGVWCTQCEPEGFRRITWYLDRPDILAPFKVTIRADRTLAPVLLSNGNLVDQGMLDENEHFAVWDDPHPKPSYLFALVAGDLGVIRDRFTTVSGREVDLAIYSAHGTEARCAWAMDSLKRSMAWDETRFGREYDLAVFNIVAVSDFNFGAMENKGLNIFNDKLVFAEPGTATDADYEGIERVIAHEYFHNWTGNRITCRDWFQLCLKEGLTVYRDQEFTSDERSRAVKRIGDVQGLRSSQFAEDAGPLAHAPRPDNYREINNFYTATVYEKGAEIVRLIATTIGEDRFRAGMDLYFERHDGEATTIEAFIKCFEEASGRDLAGIHTWYTQAGTPVVTVHQNYDGAARRLTLDVSQSTAPTPGQADKAPVTVPLRYGLIGPDGAALTHGAVSGGEQRDDVLLLEGDHARFVFEDVAAEPVVSLLRGFSAPVILKTGQSTEDRLLLARHDADPFNRWQALQDAGMALVLGAVAGAPEDRPAIEALGLAFAETLGRDDLDDAFKALALGLPDTSQIARGIGKDVDPTRIDERRLDVLRAVFSPHAEALRKAYDKLETDAPYAPDAEQSGRRALRGRLLGLVVETGAEGAARAERQYREASSMTDRFAALFVLVTAGKPEAEPLMADFRTRFAADPLVFDKWLSLVARAKDDGVIARMEAVLADPGFPRDNPNRVRSLVGTFAMANPVQFARADGAGFRFVTGVVTMADRRNANLAARLLTGFRIWPMLEAGRRDAARAALAELEGETLSRNTSEILARMTAASDD